MFRGTHADPAIGAPPPPPPKKKGGFWKTMVCGTLMFMCFSGNSRFRTLGFIGFLGFWCFRVIGYRVLGFGPKS